MNAKGLKATWDESSGAYIDCAVTRGFPLGGMGSGGFTINTDGSFTEFRCNNNWMNPIRKVRGAFLAVMAGGDACILRRYPDFKEYGNIRPVDGTRFYGAVPGFELNFTDRLPVQIHLTGFTPHIPHDIKNSTLPGTLFCLRLKNPTATTIPVAALFSWENILGLGGSGNLGIKTIGKLPVGITGKITYRDVAGNRQGFMKGRFPALLFWSDRTIDERSHRRGSVGEYLLTVDAPPGFDVTSCSGYDSHQQTLPLLDAFKTSGRISDPAVPVVGDGKVRSAAALAASGILVPGEEVQIWFALSWWTPAHVTEKDLKSNLRRKTHSGVRVGHVYENYFDGAQAVAEYLLQNRDALRQATRELDDLIHATTLPDWLKTAMLNGRDSVLTNTVIPENGNLFTLEGMDWQWPMGGLTGTNDQRLSAHPYTAVFFSELDRSELESFARHQRQDGALPHGIGNCDLALDDTSIPYAWPIDIKFILENKHWIDLVPSQIIQVAKHYRMSGDKPWVQRLWPGLKKAADYLDSICVAGVPEGGHTYDIWEWQFEGSFIYAATIYLAALRCLVDLAEELEPEQAAIYAGRLARCMDRVESKLWSEDHGYYKSTPANGNVFCGAMAGDWASRYAGLEPVVKRAKAQRHMRLSHTVLIKGARAKAAKKGTLSHPWSVAGPDGREFRYFHPMTLLELRESGIDHYVYIWQVLSYQAMEHIYLGQVEMGFDIIRMIYERFYRMGHVWSAHLLGGPISVYMTHPVIWALPNALTGAALDVPRATLKLAPQMLPGQEQSTLPVYFPGFWGLLTYNRSGKLILEITKHFGQPISIERVVFTDTGTVWDLGHLSLVRGARLDLSQAVAHNNYEGEKQWL